MSEPRIGSLGELLDQLRAAVEADGAEVSVGELMEAVGRRSFAPVLLLVGLLLVSPLSGIPSFPTLMALLVCLVSVQMLLGRRHFWLPRW
ncbi:MAG: exopolysaccharide biosynthesis protein, partial [Pseudomonadales bacterium]|nr:exopolysaccharide biosynthesis protein [Pseudomonadales bacterium]